MLDITECAKLVAKDDGEISVAEAEKQIRNMQKACRKRYGWEPLQFGLPKGVTLDSYLDTLLSALHIIESVNDMANVASKIYEGDTFKHLDAEYATPFHMCSATLTPSFFHMCRDLFTYAVRNRLEFWDNGKEFEELCVAVTNMMTEFTSASVASGVIPQCVPDNLIDEAENLIEAARAEGFKQYQEPVQELN